MRKEIKDDVLRDDLEQEFGKDLVEASDELEDFFHSQDLEEE